MPQCALNLVLPIDTCSGLRFRKTEEDRCDQSTRKVQVHTKRCERGAPPVRSDCAQSDGERRGGRQAIRRPQTGDAARREPAPGARHVPQPRLMVVRSPWPDVRVPEVSITEYVLRHAERLRDKPAIVDGVTGHALTYGELADGIRRVATALARRGFRKIGRASC